ncbi:MAG TPA: hypothetical protein VI485_16870 [Vicinamibacterales bacterium]|nr:hypothetical protein [Vicinamibacterales bacterium]
MKSVHGCVWALILVAAGVAHAQETGPWKVLVASTANPLRVAECSPVRIDVTDAKGNARNPKGVLISLADFDLSVTAGRDGAIVGRYDGAAAWSACACPGAAGATATITAAYPARSLPPESRMPGVTFQSSLTVPVIAGRSSAIPIGCEVVKTTTVGAGREVVPWAVTIMPSLRALPIGNCAPVYIDLRDAATKGGPRNPKSVLGALADGLRVPGVAFQSSTTISLAPATGTFNPPACVSPQPGPIAPASSRVLTPPGVATTPTVATGGTAAAAGGAAAGAATGGAATGRAATTGTLVGPLRSETTTRAPVNASLYEPGPASATLNLSGHGSWYEPGPVSVTLGMSGHGTWYEPGPATVTFGLSGTGTWVERTPPAGGTLQPAQPAPR